MQRLRVELPAIVALGSNLGDREQTLRDAVAAMAALPGVVVTAASDIVESAALKPDGVDKSAPSYLNAVVGLRIAISPEELLDGLNRIEETLGRERLERWGDRTLDLDIITAASVEQQDDRLTLPHPRAHERAFVLVPWLQVEPFAVLPGRGPVSELVGSVADTVRAFPAAPLLRVTR